jgi:glycosyltransferase involved in cell wall biosynthesis
MNAPLMTVLMPVYNAERFLREAMDSILQQTFADFEFLIIDDGSTDTSIDIIQSYNDPRIRLVRNEKNIGISATLNKGIELASAELIARMDADDISYPERLKKQYEYMRSHPDCGMLSTWARVITHDKKFVRLERYRSNFYYYNLTFECWIYHPTIVFTKTAVKDAGMYSMPYSEDYDLFWQIARRYKIANLTEPLVDYRLSPTSLNTVLKKDEYDNANEQNVLRNIRFYMGSDFTIKKEYLEALRHNFIPILKSGKISDIKECLRILNEISAKILGTPNVNNDPASIKGAIYFKKQFIINQCSQQLPFAKRLFLLLTMGSLSSMTVQLQNSLQWRLKNLRSQLKKI